MSTLEPGGKPLSQPEQAALTDSLSEWEAGLLAHFRDHGVREADALVEYQALVERRPDDFVRYLAGMLLEDERRHHRLFAELANALIGEANLTRIGPDVPPMSRLGDARELREQTARLLDIEKADLDELRGLRKDLKPVRQVTLWELLVRLAELDTWKHIAILRFIADAAHHQARFRD
jgi:hypothetical protein